MKSNEGKAFQLIYVAGSDAVTKLDGHIRNIVTTQQNNSKKFLTRFFVKFRYLPAYYALALSTIIQGLTIGCDPSKFLLVDLAVSGII